MPRSAASRRSVAGPHTHEKESEEPVRLTRTQWMDMLKYEDAEEAVAELMERFLNKVMDECFKVDIRQKLIPYTANWVKNDLIQIVEQRFLCRDEGDEEVLSEDSAVVPTEPDAWAQGCVPLIITSTPLQPIPPKGDVHKDAAPKEVEVQECKVSQSKVSPKLSSKKSNTKPAVVINSMQNTVPQTKTERKSYQPSMRPKPSKFLPPLSHSTEKQTPKAEKAEVEIRKSIGNSKPVPSSNLVSKHKTITKLDPASFPDHCIFPKYEILDADAKPRNPRDYKPQQKRVEAERTLKTPRCDVDVRPKNGAVFSSESGPIRLDAMTLAKGVTVSQSAELNQNLVPQIPLVKLKPIRTEPLQFRLLESHFFSDPQVKPIL